MLLTPIVSVCMKLASKRDGTMDAVFKNYVNDNLEAVRCLPVNVGAPPPLDAHAFYQRCAVIVEPRKHYALEFVVRVMAHLLDQSWSIHIWCGEDNEQFIGDMLQGVPYRLTKLDGVHNLTVEDYNRLCLSIPFWRHIHAETILIFQTDSLMLKPASELEPFLDYDMVGGPTGIFAGEEFFNGGFSLRKRSAMVEALRKVPVRRMGEGSRTLMRIASKTGMCSNPLPDREEAEDQFFFRAMPEIGGNLPSMKEASTFATDTVPAEDPIAFHKVWAWQPIGNLQRLLDVFTERYL